ncbi:unnamed protein product [Phytophthora lilii]|uniref:Unnamed protein product n=1 Tax=Phytophthora lilii TaxID=2077276 RepID=A0A9W6XAZ2_9STRA|nr:unnamed protein product [Phytophthora lilii]
MESSNASPIGFGLQMNNATNATSTNSAYIGTTTTNNLVLMTANTRRVTITSAGRVAIGTGSPRAGLEVAAALTSYTQTNVATNTYSYDDSSNTCSCLRIFQVGSLVMSM